MNKTCVILAIIISALLSSYIINEFDNKRKEEEMIADITKIQDYYLGKITLTDEELIKYDVNKDGVVDLFDAMAIKNNKEA